MRCSGAIAGQAGSGTRSAAIRPTRARSGLTVYEKPSTKPYGFARRPMNKMHFVGLCRMTNMNG
jgi:hypothetical protein